MAATIRTLGFLAAILPFIQFILASPTSPKKRAMSVPSYVLNYGLSSLEEDIRKRSLIY